MDIFGDRFNFKRTTNLLASNAKLNPDACTAGGHGVFRRLLVWFYFDIGGLCYVIFSKDSKKATPKGIVGLRKSTCS